MRDGLQLMRGLRRRRAFGVIGVALLLIVSMTTFAVVGAGSVTADEPDESDVGESDYIIADDTIYDAETGEELPDEADYAVNGDAIEAEPGETVQVPFEAQALTGNEDSDITSMDVVVEYDDRLEFVDGNVPIADSEDVTIEDEGSELHVEWDPGFLNQNVELLDPISWFADGPTMNSDVLFLEFEVDDDTDHGETVSVDLAEESELTSGKTDTFSSYEDQLWWGGSDVSVTADDETPVATFTAESEGGLVAFNDGSEDEARSEGVEFPGDEDDDDPFVIQGEIYEDGTWESTDTVFPPFEATSGIEADVETRFGLEGEIDSDGDFMTTEGEMTVIVDGDPDNQFSFDLDGTTAESNELTGDASLPDGNDGDGSVTVVDNEFTVDDSTGNTFIDGALELPSPDAESNWLELKLDLDVTEVPDAGVGTVEGQVETEDGEQISDAAVETVDDGPSTVTDENGSYELENVATGTHELEVDADGYEPVLAEVTVDQGEVTAQNFTLASEDGDGVDDGDDTGDDDVADDEFLATSTGGFISFDEDNYDDAVDEGLDFEEDADDPIQIRGELDDDGTWESTETVFPTLFVQGDITAEIETVNGLEGEFDPETGEMTAIGELTVYVNGEEDTSFTMDIELTHEESGALEGDAAIDGDSAEVTLVDNEFTVDERTGESFIDDVLGLPMEDEGQGWFELDFDVELDDDFDGQVEESADEDDDDDDTDTGAATSILTGLGQALGLLGVISAAGLLLLNVIGRLS